MNIFLLLVVRDCSEIAAIKHHLRISDSTNVALYSYRHLLFSCFVRVCCVVFEQMLGDIAQNRVGEMVCPSSYVPPEGRLSCKKLLHMLAQKLQKAANVLKITFGIVDNFLKGQLF